MNYKAGKLTLHSSVVFLAWLGALVFGFVYRSHIHAAPFGEFATALTLGASSYWAKRHFDKKFNNTNNTAPGTPNRERQYYE